MPKLEALPEFWSGMRKLLDGIPQPCPDSTGETRPLEARLVTAVNQARADTIRCADQLFGPLAPLATSAELGCAARKHSADMAGRGFFAHQNPDGETVRERAQRAGHLAGRVSENLAWGQTRPEDVLIAWKASPQHCRNLMDSRYRKLGVGLAYGAAGKPFWTAVFAQ